MKHSLTVVIKTDDDSIFKGAAAGAGKFSVDKISWFMPHVIPADTEKFSIYKTIESKVKLPVAYRTRQCDILSVPESKSFTWRLSVKTVDYNLSLSNQKFSRVYGDAALFGVKFFGMNELITQSNITPSDYKHFTLFHVRCQQAERKTQILCS